MQDSASIETRKVRTPTTRKPGGPGGEKRPRKTATKSAGAANGPAGLQVGSAAAQAGSPETRRILLEFFQPQAREIFVAGSFNEWNPQTTRLSPQGDGKWLVELSLQPGTYEYRFVVDGVWTDDPLSAEHAANPFGEFNSVLQVRPSI